MHNGGRGIYGLRYSNDGEEVIAGGSDGSIMVYNLHRDGLNIDIKAHFNDVNSVCFLDGVGMSLHVPSLPFRQSLLNRCLAYEGGLS